MDEQQGSTIAPSLPATTTGAELAPARCSTCGRLAGDPWCKVGKPAAIGGALGLGAGLVTGMDAGRGLLWGAVAGALLGWWRK